MAGCTVHYNPDQTCVDNRCTTVVIGKKQQSWPVNLHDFNTTMPIVSPSASCTGFVKFHYPKILKDNSELLARMLVFILNSMNYLIFSECVKGSELG